METEMVKNTLWLAVSALMALSLVITACGPTVAPTTPTAPVAPTTPTAPVTPATPNQEKPQTGTPQPTAEVPRHGGVLNMTVAGEVQNWNQILGIRTGPWGFPFIDDDLLIGDWAKGPAGAGETTWRSSGYDRLAFKTGLLAESWEFVGPDTVIFRIRKGARFAVNPASEASRLVGGREVTAADVAFSLKLVTTHPQAYIYRTGPSLRNADITAPDKSTVKVKVSDGSAMALAMTRLSNGAHTVAPEVWQKYGEGAWKWYQHVGEGPFMVTDYVPASTGIFKKNPNWFMKDTAGPGKGSQLPYLDGIRILIIPDLSTQQAAFRTGKLDWIETTKEPALDFLAKQPKLKMVAWPDEPYNIAGPMYKAPYSDIRVRRALQLALDYDTIIETLYGGQRALPGWPIQPLDQYVGAYLPLGDAPASVQELFSYNPEKAKQLLKEAGYPNGFKAELRFRNSARDLEMAEVAVHYFSKIGVQVTLKPYEAGVWSALSRWERLAGGLAVVGAGSPPGLFYAMQNFRGDQESGNYGLIGWNSATEKWDITDPIIEEAFRKTQEALSDRSDKGFLAAAAIHKELMKYVLDQAYVIQGPTYFSYLVWWPWLKNYHGEFAMGYVDRRNWVNFVWYDEALRKEMGY